MLSCNLNQNCSHTLFSPKLIFSLSSLWKAPNVCENPSVTDDRSSCLKRADWFDKTLGFQPGGGYPVWCYVPGNARVQQTRAWNWWQAGLWHPDMGYRGCCGYWSTWAEKAQKANVLILTRSGGICLLVWTHKVHLLLKKLSKLDIWKKTLRWVETSCFFKNATYIKNRKTYFCMYYSTKNIMYFLIRKTFILNCLLMLETKKTI